MRPRRVEVISPHVLIPISYGTIFPDYLFFYLQDSLKLAKEAVTLDAGCGESWYVMGNAYVASFFRNSRGLKDLDRALQAYSKAVRQRRLLRAEYFTKYKHGNRW